MIADEKGPKRLTGAPQTCIIETEISEKESVSMKILSSAEGRTPELSRDAIKYIAMVTMLLNHIAHIFLSPDTVLYELFLDLGYFTAVTMCYFLVEGYHYTHSPRNYALRLFVFAILSQFPYSLAFTEPDSAYFVGFNMLFTLLSCFLILVVHDKVQNKMLRTLVIALLMLLTLWSDWPILAPVFTLLFLRANGDKRRVLYAYAMIAPIFMLFDLMNRTGTTPLWQALLLSLGAAGGIVLSGICLLYFYHGKRGKHTGAFSKWFFYVFYPAHLLILGLLNRLLAT